jgi:hypothetical protein
MRLTYRLAPALAAFAFAVAAGSLEAQQAPAQNAQQVQAWMAEMQQLQAQLGPLQMRAFQEDPTLVQQQEALGASIKSAVQKSDPGLVERMEQMQTQAVQAQQAGDAQKLQQLSTEAMQLTQRLASAQKAVMQDASIAGQYQQFQRALEARMTALDPQARPAMDRYKELAEKLGQAMGQ